LSLFQKRQEAVAAASSPEESHSTRTRPRDKVQGMGTVVSPKQRDVLCYRQLRNPPLRLRSGQALERAKGGTPEVSFWERSRPRKGLPPAKRGAI
jgi:hypothetical protein